MTAPSTGGGGTVLLPLQAPVPTTRYMAEEVEEEGEAWGTWGVEEMKAGETLGEVGETLEEEDSVWILVVGEAEETEET